MSAGDHARFDAAALDAWRPRLIRFCVVMGLLTVFTLSWVTWDLTRVNLIPRWVLGLLAAVFASTLVGAFLIGRRRQLTIRADRSAAALVRTPTWLGPVLAVVPGVVIVGTQVIGRASSIASDALGVLAAYLLTWFVGLTLGLVVVRSPEDAG